MNTKTAKHNPIAMAVRAMPKRVVRNRKTYRRHEVKASLRAKGSMNDRQ